MKSKKSKYIIVAISILVGLLHFVIGHNYHGLFQGFVNGYLIDILLPLNLYLLVQLSIRNRLSLKLSRTLAIISIFMFGFFVEILQYYGISFLGSTFDPIDFLMYSLGVLSGLAIDKIIMEKIELKANTPHNKVMCNATGMCNSNDR